MKRRLLGIAVVLGFLAYGVMLPVLLVPTILLLFRFETFNHLGVFCCTSRRKCRIL